MITLKGVTKIFDNSVERVTALKNVSLTFENKGMVFINGYSGAGKSTLLSIIGGIDVASSGNVVVDNFSLKNLASVELDKYRNNYVGFVFESINLIDTMTVEENIRVSCAFNGKEPSETQMEYLIDKFKLGSIRKRKPNQISLGQKQKVGIARALAKDPYLYLADDPTGHVDAKRADEIWAILKEISKKRLVIAVSHDSRILEKYADRIITLDNGEVVEDVVNTSTHKVSKSGAVKDAVSDVIDLSQTKSATEIINQKHKFSFKNLLWLTKNNLRFKTMRYVSIILLTAFALMSFSLFTVLNRFDRVEVLAKSITQNDMEYVTFVKEDGGSVTTKEYNEVLVDYKKTYGKDFQPGRLIDFSGRLTQVGSTAEYNINYVINQVYTQETETYLGQKILYGRRSAGELEWMVSDYTAEQIKRELKLNSQSDVVGKQFISSSYNLNANQNITIVGVYDTDYESYINLETFESNGNKPHELEYNLKYIYSVAIVGDGYVDRIISDNAKDSTYVILATDPYSGSIYSSGAAVSVRKKDAIDSEGIWRNGLKEAVAKENWLGLDEFGVKPEIVLSMNFFNDYFKKIDAFKDDYSESGLTNEYLNQFGCDLQNLLKPGYSLNITMSFNGEYERTFWIHGITTTSEIIVSNNDYDNIFGETKFETKGVIVKAGSSEKMMEELIVELENKGFKFTSTTSDKIDEFNTNIAIFKTIFLAGSVLFACFVGVLLYYFVYTLIAERKQAIGILRTFGARGRDILKIFLTTGVVVLLGIMIVGSIGTIISAHIGNLYARSAMSTMFSVFNVSIIDFGLLFGISLLMILLGTCIPIARYVKDDPYNNIKGR